MSLDVTLLIPGKDREDFNSYELRHLATNFAITCEKGYKGSYDSWFKGLPTTWREIANKDNPDYEQPTEEVYGANITHNLSKMAGKAGIYEALWRPHLLHPSCTKEMKEDFDSKDRERWEKEYVFEDSVKMYAKDIIPLLEKGLKKLKAKPEYYEKFNSPNGWGMYEHFVPFVEKYLQACKEFPESIISVSR